MNTATLRYDDRNMFSKKSGAYGVSTGEWKGIQSRLRRAKSEVIRLHKSQEQGFMALPGDRAMVTEIRRAAARLPRVCDSMIVLGIGGSDLGARALDQAIMSQRRRKGVRLIFSGGSTDPDELWSVLRSVDFKKTCVNVISKSGDTLETMTAFLVFRERLAKAVGKKKASERTIATTDPDHGSLHDLAEHENYTRLPVPQNVGGRFSVLSPVGLFPALASGIDIDKLLKGAGTMFSSFVDMSASRHPAMRYAALHVIGMSERRQNIHVFMPYARRLREFALWVRQLVAESLGKRTDRRGRVVHTGPTPVAALGPEDQHSQLQLYAEGPYDKLVTFLGVASFANGVATPSAALPVSALNRFGRKSFDDLIHLELEATAESLRRLGRPNGTIAIPQLDEASMGALFMFFELAVASMGELMNINAYDQPGVESSKTIMHSGLAKL